MSHPLTAMILTPGITYCTKDGTPYRADWSGLVHVLPKHAAELAAATPPPGAAVALLATATQIGAGHHRGAPLTFIAENS